MPPTRPRRAADAQLKSWKIVRKIRCSEPGNHPHAGRSGPHPHRLIRVEGITDWMRSPGRRRTAEQRLRWLLVRREVEPGPARSGGRAGVLPLRRSRRHAATGEYTSVTETRAGCELQPGATAPG
jgi:hypothetical protein